MRNTFGKCPYCSKTVMKGAMRCVACGKTLQTPEEQLAAIEKLQSKQKFNINRLVHYTIMLTILGLLYYYFSERLIGAIKNIIGI
ncbi:MAG: hypothetical protein JSV11_09135 [Nitrospiraceae bacterium]|nr:MAG: hypothetical protein JSV11_09135 [Nitrospiraceae bacterium]